MQNISLHKKSFFNSIGLNVKDMPKELMIKPTLMQKDLPKEDLKFLSNKKLADVETKHFRLKNLVGTTNANMQNKTWVELFVDNEKSDDMVKQYFKNPNYYFKELRKIDQSELNHNNDLVLYEDSGKFFVKDGVGRLSLMMIKYLSEMSRATSKEEKMLINKKYIFAADVISVPKDRDIMHLISMLSDIYGEKLNIQKVGNKDTFGYTFKYGEKTIIINTKEELENFVKNSYLPKNCKSIDKLTNKVNCLVDAGLKYKTDEDNIEGFLVLGKIFPNYEIFLKYYERIRNSGAENKLYEKIDVENVSYETILKHSIKLVKQEVKNMKSKSAKKEKIDKKAKSTEKTEIKKEEKAKENSKKNIEENEIDIEKYVEDTSNELAQVQENLSVTFFKIKKEESEMHDLADSLNTEINIDKIDDNEVNDILQDIKNNAKRLVTKSKKIKSEKEYRKIKDCLKDINKISIDRSIAINYSEEMKVLFDKSLNKKIQKLITDSKLKKLEIKKQEIEKEKCSLFSRILGKAKLKQAKLDNVNLKMQLIVSESQYADTLCYYLEDGLSDLYAYIKNEDNEECLSDIRVFLRNIETNVRLKKLIDYNKLENQTKEKLSRQVNLPVLSLSREKRRLFSKKQINFMEEKNNELKRVIQITRANSLKNQNTGIVPIIGNLKSTKAFAKFIHNLREINKNIEYEIEE